jgi:hypothetical protein
MFLTISKTSEEDGIREAGSQRKDTVLEQTLWESGRSDER